MCTRVFPRNDNQRIKEFSRTLIDCDSRELKGIISDIRIARMHTMHQPSLTKMDRGTIARNREPWSTMVSSFFSVDVLSFLPLKTFGAPWASSNNFNSSIVAPLQKVTTTRIEGREGGEDGRNERKEGERASVAHHK